MTLCLVDQSLDKAELLELFSQAHRLEGRDREALKAVLEAMLTRSRVSEALHARKLTGSRAQIL